MEKVKIWNKINDNIGLPQETLGFSKEKYLKATSFNQDYLIKRCNLSNLMQIDDIKKQLLRSNILIINAKEILENKQLTLEELRLAIEEIKDFLSKRGGSIGRLGDNYLILTPNAYVKISQ